MTDLDTEETGPLSICTDCAQEGALERIDVLFWDPECPDLVLMSHRERETWADDPEAEERAWHAYAAAISRRWESWTLAVGCSPECEWCHGAGCEPSFSWSACDWCGIPLGGDRHNATAWRRVPPADVLDEMTASYVASAIWTGQDWSEVDDDDPEADPNPRPLDENYGAGDLTPWAESVARETCARFGGAFWPLAESHGWTPDQFGHDLNLTRNGHGTGFWDRRYGSEWTDEDRAAGDRLSEAARLLSESELMIGDGGDLDWSTDPSGAFGSDYR